MEKYLKKIKPKYYWLVALILTAITYTIFFSYMGMLENGIYTIARSDLKQQYIPFIELFCDVLRGEHSYWFSWALNWGTGTSLLFAYYTLSPFNMIYLLLGEDMAMTATAIVIILKASLAAATFQVFISKYLRKNYYETVLFAMMYALCGFQVCYYFNIMWMDAFFMLPVIMLGIIKLLRERKTMLLLVSYTYVFAVNFYMGYIIGLSTFFLFLFCFFYQSSKRKLKENISILFYYGSSAVCAVLLCAVIWLPAVIQLFDNLEENYPDFSTSGSNPLFLYNNLFMGQMQTLNGITPFIYCGLLSLILLPFFFVNKHIGKKKRIYIGLCLVWLMCLFFIEPLNKMMHAFDRPEMFEQRFSYVFSFIILVACCEQFIYIRQTNRKMLYMFGIVNLIVFAVSYFLYRNIYGKSYNANTLLTLAINVIFFWGWLLVIKKIKSRQWDILTYRVVLSFLIMIELGANSAVCMNRMEHKTFKQESYEAWRKIQKDTFDKIKSNEHEDEFYRIMYHDLGNMNQSFLYNYNGVENFCSSEHKNVLKVLEKLGFYRGMHTLKGAGTTPITRSLFNIKYIVEGNSFEYENDSNEACLTYEKNNQALSLGYMVSYDIRDFEFVESPFENQNNLLSSMAGVDTNCYERIGMEMTVENGEYVKTDDATYLFSKSSGGELGKFTFKTINKGKPLYIYFLQDRYVDETGGADIPTIETTDMSYLKENSIIQPRLIPARIIQIGTNEDGKYEFSINLTEGLESDYYKKAFFCYYDDNEFQKAYEVLQNQQLMVETYEDGYLKGTIDVLDDGIMFTSVPYDKGWSIIVDGKTKEYIPLIDEAFIGIELEKGFHEIEMYFEPTGRKEGIKISITTLIILLSICTIRKITKGIFCA